MAANPALMTPVQEQQRVPLAEWLKLRRPPLPDYVKSLDQLPPILSNVVVAALPPGKVVDGALVLPAEYFARKASGWEYVPQRTLVFLGDSVLLAYAETMENRPQVMTVHAASLLYARSSLVLLYGLLELKADCGGQATEVRLEYNSVVWETFRSSLMRFVGAANPSGVPGGEAETKSANDGILKTLPYKFANGLQYNGLTPGERLELALFQPEIRQGHWILSRQVTPNTVLALSETKVIFIEETVSAALHRQPSKGEHGWTFTYIPRERVVDVGINAGPGRAELKVIMQWGGVQDQRTLVLDPQVAARFQYAWFDV